MVRPITIQDNGGDRYTITTTITTLGRRYDNNAESIVVNFPQAEIDAGHICTMIVTAFGKVVDHIEVENGVEVPITSNLSQYSEIKIGFSFTDDENYVKNSEIKTFKFLEAQKPDGFVPEPPQQSGNIDMLIRKGFVDVGQEGSYVIFYNLAHEEVARIRIQGGGGGGGCTVYVNGEEVEELLFTSDPQTQITALAEAMTLVQNSLSEKATIEYVDAKFNGASKAISYGDYETMITAFNALDDDVYGIGQDVYIVTRDVPDLWISSVEETSVPYVYVDDATFVTALTTTGYVQVGYYKFSYLETQKVDLTDYATLNTDQKFTSVKTFKSVPVAKEFKFVYDVDNPSSRTALTIKNDNGYNAKIIFSNYGLMFTGSSVYPVLNKSQDFGANGYMWKDMWMFGKLKDGTNEVSVAELVPTKVDCSSALVVDNDTSLTVLRKEMYFVKSKNTIKMVVYYSAKNETESAVNSVRIINTNAVLDDTFILNNLKDMNGNALSTATAGTICVANQLIYNDGNMVTKPIRVTHTATNQLTLYDGSAINIPANGSVIISIEVEWFVG